MQKKVYVFILVIILTISNCSHQMTSKSADMEMGADNIIQIEEAIKNFDKISIGAFTDVDIKFGENYKVTIQVNENFKEYTEIKKDDDLLKIDFKEGSYKNKTYKVNIVMPELSYLKANNSKVTFIRNKKDTTYNLCKNLKIKAGAFSEIDFSKLTVENANIELDGGKLTINVKKEVEAKLKSFSNLQLYGNSVITELDVDSGAEIEMVNN